ncbi:hypothetical protein K7432_008439 [Basidiobolus ranarum]|uniref:Homeobox domain-containing protein n=1 Tax=Basidiobolus ranarum TaxID=34480 RepID=A0ABR2WS33_9FUNG
MGSHSYTAHYVPSVTTHFSLHHQPNQRGNKITHPPVYHSTNGFREANIHSNPPMMYSEHRSPNYPQNPTNLCVQNTQPQSNIREIGPSQNVYGNPTYEPDISPFHPIGFPTVSNVELQRYHPYDAHMGEETQCNSTVKPKRKRANATQLKVLNQLFQQTFFPSTELRIQLGKQLGMSPRTVQIWFQNKRQAWRIRNKFFANKNERFDDIPSSPETSAATTPTMTSPKSSTCPSPDYSVASKSNGFQLPSISQLESSISADYKVYDYAHHSANRSLTNPERPLLPSLNEIIKREPRTIGLGSFHY